MKTFNEFLIESLNEAEKKYSFTDQEYQEWVDLKKDSKIVKDIEQFIKDMQHVAKEEAYVAYNDNAEEYEGGKFASYDVLGDLEKNKVVEWWKDTDCEDFHTEYVLKNGKDGLRHVLDYIKKTYDTIDGRDPEEAPGEAVYDYYKVCHGLSDAEYKKEVKWMSVEACKKEYGEWKYGV